MAETNGRLSYEQFVANVAMSRAALIRQLVDGSRRDINDECQYPHVPDVSVYQQLYDREAIAARVVQVMPRECWQVQPEIYEDEDPAVETEFERAWRNLPRQLRGENSWYDDEYQSLVWDYLRRADEFSGIGYYGVLLLGIDDGLELSQPAQPGGTRRLIYMRAFPQTLAKISTFEQDITSPRYGMPDEYEIIFADPAVYSNGNQFIAGGVNQRNIRVHWTRVIHVSEGEVYHTPRMQPVLNRLFDVRKLYSASAEGFWKSCFAAMSFETHPQLGGDVEYNTDDLKAMYERYINGLDRALFTAGMQVKSIAPSVVDPTPQIAAQIEAICVQLAIPKRIFAGSERGELASSQDDSTWNERKRERMCNYLAPRLVGPFVDRLIWLGVLPKPKSYTCEWPDLEKQSDLEKADVAVKQTQALVQYINGNAEHMVPPLEFLTAFLGFSDSEATAILEAAMSYQQDENAITLRTDLRPANPSTELIALLETRAKGLIDDATLQKLIELLYQIPAEDAAAIQVDQSGIDAAKQEQMDAQINAQIAAMA